MALSFAPNGLLAKPSTKLDDDATSPLTNDAKLDFTPLFHPNGLLSTATIATSALPTASSSRSESPVQTNTESQSPKEQSTFVPNGLLSLTRQEESTTTPMDIESVMDETLDDDNSFPRPSQLLLRARAGIATPSERVDSRLVRCKTFEGRTLFFPRRKKDASRPLTRPRPEESLENVLEVPLHRLMDDLAAKALDPTVVISSGSSSSKQSQGKKDLWVDRYRPQRFVDLAGDERVNRETLAWVKEWDQCVFNVKKRKLKRKRETEESEETIKVDQWGRPREKILLVSGPPGLGKTTLAYVVAKQAGYDVLEINASDARSGSVIDDRIRPALESGHAMGSEKPVLIVIDEVDGATGEGSGHHAGFINRLVGLTFDPPKKKNANGTRHSRRPLLRPIICICNDLYAPSLAKLRLHARIIRIHPSPPLVLTKRLKTICTEESLRTEGRALSLLAEICQGDIRSCLNALQFMKMKSPTSGVTEELVRNATTGVKEAETSVQSVFADLFTPMTKKRAKNQGLGNDEEARWVSRLVHSVETSGSVDKIALGAFEHYTTLHPHETTLNRFESANDWLSFYDTVSSAARYEQEYSLQTYLPYTLVPLFHHLAATGNPKVEKPNDYWESVTTAKAGEEVFSKLAKSILHPEGGQQQRTVESAGYRHLLGKDVLRTEFVPILNRLISPPMRPVNKQIIKAEEKLVLNRLVEIMVTTGLRYEQDKSEDGQLLYRLEPAIDSFIVYDGKRATDVGAARYAVRHMIASEVDEALSARQNRIVEKTAGADGRMAFGRKAKGSDDSRAEPVIDIADKPAVDFFGRPIVLQPKPTQTTSASDPNNLGLDQLLPKKVTVPFHINYRYNEGNSSAVRKPTKVATFL